MAAEGAGGRERRRAPRVKVRSGVGGRVFSVIEARLVDVSTVGALLEHADPIRPGMTCEVMIGGERDGVRLRCQIVRSALTQRGGTAGRQVCYQTGVEFTSLTPAQTAVLQALIGRHGGDGRDGLVTGLTTFLTLF